MFLHSNFCKKDLNYELLQVSFGKYNLQLEFESLNISIFGDMIVNKYPKIFYNSRDYRQADSKPLISLIGLKIIEIKEFAETNKHPYGYLIIYFEKGLGVIIEFHKHYELVMLNFKKDGGCLVF